MAGTGEAGELDGDTGGRSQGVGLLGGYGAECGFCSEVDARSKFGERQDVICSFKNILLAAWWRTDCRRRIAVGGQGGGWR